MKLISSRLFGKSLRSEEPGFKRRIDYLEWYEKLRNNFDDFLKQPLEKWMFVPCKLVDGIWDVLEEPDNYQEYCNCDELDDYNNRTLEYQKEKDRCLFEGFVVRNENWVSNGYVDIDDEFCQSKTIEDLIKYTLELTPTAQKQIGS